MSERVCPWWVGYLLASPVRRVLQRPEDILAPYIKEGNTVLDAGSAMGFFSLPMARLVGESGHVVCVDLQDRMIRTLRKRAVKANLIQRIELRVCTTSSLCINDLAEKIDFALAFAVVHEVPDAQHLLSEIHASLKNGGLLLFSEPTGHVSKEMFDATLSIAKTVGFHMSDSPSIRRGYSSVLLKS